MVLDQEMRKFFECPNCLDIVVPLSACTYVLVFYAD
jgi:hypothetical protein